MGVSVRSASHLTLEDSIEEETDDDDDTLVFGLALPVFVPLVCPFGFITLVQDAGHVM